MDWNQFEKYFEIQKSQLRENLGQIKLDVVKKRNNIKNLCQTLKKIKLKNRQSCYHTCN